MIKRYSKNQLDELAQILKNDGIISVPTDTVYGVCAQINSQKAFTNLVELKNRPNTKPFPIMCADEEQIKDIAIVDKRAETLIHTFMPGPITLVLNKKDKVPDYVSNGKKTIAVRMATSEELKELIKKVGCPIFMSSANKSGEEVCNNLDEIEKNFPQLNGMLEGNVSFNKPSTIIDCSADKIEVLRSGPISSERIFEALDI